MSTLCSTEGAPGHSWKLNRDAKGLKLWVPQSGRASKPHRLKVNEADPAKWAADIIDVAVDQLPQVLLDALRSSGEFLQSNYVPCVELYFFLPCCVLLSCAEASTDQSLTSPAGSSGAHGDALQPMHMDETSAGAPHSRRAPHASNPLRPVPNRARKSHTHFDLMLLPCLGCVQESPLHRRPSSRHPHHTPPPPPDASGLRLGGRARPRRIRCGGYSSPRRRLRSWCLMMPPHYPHHPRHQPHRQPHRQSTRLARWRRSRSRPRRTWGLNTTSPTSRPLMSCAVTSLATTPPLHRRWRRPPRRPSHPARWVDQSADR